MKRITFHYPISSFITTFSFIHWHSLTFLALTICITVQSKPEHKTKISLIFKSAFNPPKQSCWSNYHSNSKHLHWIMHSPIQISSGKWLSTLFTTACSSHKWNTVFSNFSPQKVRILDFNSWRQFWTNMTLKSHLPSPLNFFYLPFRIPHITRWPFLLVEGLIRNAAKT